jgi:hypothetical protein
MISVKMQKMVGPSKKGISPKIKNSLRHNAAESDYQVPGPGKYGASGSLGKGGFKMGKDTRRGLGDGNTVPGPGSYGLGRAQSHGVKFGKSGRDDGNKTSGDVGPGQYNWTKVNKQTSSYSFGRDRRQDINDPVIFS